jgi:RimJ/RimL family protein N-acetyltransferase
VSSIDPTLIDIPKELRSERVFVRLLEDADAEALFESIEESREPLERWTLWAKDQVGVADSLAYIRRSQADWLLRRRLPVGIFDSASGRLLGCCGLEGMDWQKRAFEIGYWVRASAEGHGYVQDAVRLLTTLAFERFGANRVQIRMDPRNARSERVAQRAGYVLEATIPTAPVDGTDHSSDRHIYVLTPESYRRLPWAR